MRLNDSSQNSSFRNSQPLRKFAIRAMRLLLLATVGLCATSAQAQFSLEKKPINYLTATATDAVAQLQKRIDAGEVELKYDAQHGYLKSVLEYLNVSATTQALVFSKTSFQVRHITPQTPRAIYFNDDVYVGWVQQGRLLEFSTVDSNLGANFYSLSQQKSDAPQFKRHTYECLQCHSGALTRGIPGHMVRSVYPGLDGLPIYSAGTHLSDHSSPLKERWGGWYVTGKHGDQRHLGNLLVSKSDNPNRLDTNRGANLDDLSSLFDTKPYLTSHSDIAALMVLEHQVNMQNRISRANFLTRAALHDEQTMNRALKRPVGFRSESTKRRIQSAATPLVKHLLFCKEIELTAPIVGTSGFTQQFTSRGPRDRQGRSLYELDLKRRLFKYPCSYLIYSAAFDNLPPLVKDVVYRELWNVLNGLETGDDYRHLSAADRTAILEILRETKRDLPDYWKPTIPSTSTAKQISTTSK